MSNKTALSDLNIPLERDIFLRSLIRELAGTLEEVVGYNEAAGYVSLVGQKIGEWLNETYRRGLNVSSLSPSQVADVLVDLKQRIHGDFFVVRHDGEKIILGCRRCPFEEKVLGRPSMCMMTSNVFGVIAAENLGYAKVVLNKTIADGDKECEVIVHLKATPDSEAAEGREYFRSAEENAG